MTNLDSLNKSFLESLYTDSLHTAVINKNINRFQMNSEIYSKFQNLNLDRNQYSNFNFSNKDKIKFVKALIYFYLSYSNDILRNPSFLNLTWAIPENLKTKNAKNDVINKLIKKNEYISDFISDVKLTFETKSSIVKEDELKSPPISKNVLMRFKTIFKFFFTSKYPFLVMTLIFVLSMIVVSYRPERINCLAKNVSNLNSSSLEFAIANRLSYFET